VWHLLAHHSQRSRAAAVVLLAPQQKLELVSVRHVVAQHSQRSLAAVPGLLAVLLDAFLKAPETTEGALLQARAVLVMALEEAVVHSVSGALLACR